MIRSASTIAAVMLTFANIIAQKPLTLEITTPGSKEYKKIRPSYANAYFDDKGNLIISKKKTTEPEKNTSKFPDKNIFKRAKNIDVAPISGNVAFTKGNDMYIYTDSVSSPACFKGNDGIVVGQAVHRNEFGITKGTFWSPQGDKLAFYVMDERMVSKYPLVNVKTRIASTKNIRYPMAGETSHEVKVKIYNTTDRSTTTLQTEMSGDSYFTNIAWSPDGSMISIAELNRDQNTMHFNIYDALNGNLIQTLFTETDSRWIDPCHPALFLDNNNLAWLSDRDGFTHIYLYNILNGECKQLTSGNWCVSQMYGYSAKTKSIYFQANKRGPLYKDIYSVSLKGTISCLTTGEGIHNARFAPDCSSFIDMFSAPHLATSTTHINNKGKVLKTIAQTENPYKGYTLPSMEITTLKSADGLHDLYGLMIKPSNFKADKKYPTVVYVYGGPKSQMVHGGWLYGASPWLMFLAEQGYIVWVMDNRGTELRGSEYEKCIYRKLGVNETNDQMVGINYLRSLPYVDSDNIGVHGWSYGGFMTLTLMCDHPDIFKAGVSGGPVVDWSLYEVMYGERYMDTPQENPDGYETTSILNKIEKLKGRLLVIHGDIDPVVVWQHSLKLIHKAVEKDVMIDYAVYPQHEHNVLGPDRVHLLKRIIRYFDDNLKR